MHEGFDKNKTFLYPNYCTSIIYIDGASNGFINPFTLAS